MRRLALFLVLIVACQRADEKKKINTTTGSAGSAGSAAATVKTDLPKVEQVTPKLDIKTPPADAKKTSSGVTYKKLVEKPDAPQAKRNDTVMINYVGWKHATGETFFSNKAHGQPIPLNLASTAIGFTEALQEIRKGETAMLWIPPDVGYKGPPQGKPEMLVYEIEVVDIVAAPPVPEDYKSPPADAKTLKSGAKYVVVKAGGKERARYFDTVTFDYTAWDSEGRMFDSTEMRKRPATVPPFRQSAAMQEMLTTAAKGERVRFWIDSEKMAVGGKATGLPAGLVCYEIELREIEKAKGTPPPVPADVAAPPANAQKTPKGVSYKVLKKGKGGAKPAASDSVRVHYTGWTTDGRMFDSSVVKGEPATFPLTGVIAGWTDGIPVMAVGDRVRFWIPEELAYKGSPGKPQGMLVFDVELLEIMPPQNDPHGGDPHGHGKQPAAQSAPPDVAAPPKDAKKSPKGVFYKILQPAKKPGPKPTATDTVKVHYTGWTTDGQMFDSSVGKQPIEFPLTGVIQGWTDAIPMLSVGDKARLWIPQELAYQGQEGAPKGMLVFDVELLDIKKQ
jgi:FKBP-type peptidyl-prolyl cis-trans isomerase